MNIFQSLSEGYGRLTETNLSAFLRFLLSPNEAHGFRDMVLRQFLKAVASSSGDAERFDDALQKEALEARIALEVLYAGAQDQRIDLEIEIFDQTGEHQRKLHHIVVENKIKAASAQVDQLVRQFECVCQAMSEEESAPITMVFLTPPGDDKRLQDQFSNLSIDQLTPHRKTWLRWHGTDESHDTIVSLLRKVLLMEACAQIEPIADYMRHTLKAFIMFLERNVEMSQQKRIGSKEPGSVVSQETVTLDGRTYTITRMSDGVIQVFDDADEEVRAYPILRQVNIKYGFNLSLTGSTGKSINTQLFGRRLLERLAQRNNDSTE